MNIQASATSFLSGTTRSATFFKRLLSLSGGGRDSFCFQPTSHHLIHRCNGVSAAMLDVDTPGIGGGSPLLPTDMAAAAPAALIMYHLFNCRGLRAGRCEHNGEPLE